MMKRTMKYLLTASLTLLATTAHSHELLVGSYTDSLYRYGFDSTIGQLSAEPLQVFKSSNPSWLTLSKDHKRLFAVNEQPNGEVSSFALDAGNVLAAVNQVSSNGDEPTHSSLAPDGKFLFVANYGVNPKPGGSLVALPVTDDGQLLASVQLLQNSASGVNPERQAGPHVHSAVFSPDGQYLFASDLGADKVFVYRYDGDNPQHPLTPANPPSVDLPPGSGPRHLVFSKNGKHAYLTLEMNAEVVMFDHRDGVLVPRQFLPLSESDKPATKAAGAVHLTADGRFLYVSNRGTANELLVFVVNPQDGTLQFIQRRSVEGDHPREFALDPTEGYVLVANQKSDAIVIIKRDPQTGLLGKTLQSFELKAPSDLKFLD